MTLTSAPCSVYVLCSCADGMQGGPPDAMMMGEGPQGGGNMAPGGMMGPPQGIMPGAGMVGMQTGPPGWGAEQMQPGA